MRGRPSLRYFVSEGRFERSPVVSPFDINDTRGDRCVVDVKLLIIRTGLRFAPVWSEFRITWRFGEESSVNPAFLDILTYANLRIKNYFK